MSSGQMPPGHMILYNVELKLFLLARCLHKMTALQKKVRYTHPAFTDKCPCMVNTMELQKSAIKRGRTEHSARQPAIKTTDSSENFKC